MSNGRIVGVDPGTTTGIAVLDLEGNLVASTSRKEFARGQIIEYIIGQGTPLILATDVTPSPSTVKRLASNLGAELYVPDHDLSQQGLIQDFPVTSKDTHVKDALAAAFKAYQQHKDLLGKTRRKADEAGVTDELDAILQEVLGSSKSTSQIVREFKQDEQSEQQPTTEQHSQQHDWQAIAEQRHDEINRKDTKIQRLEEYNSQLQDKIDTLEEEYESLQQEQTQKIRKSQEIQRLNNKLQQKESQISSAKQQIQDLEGRIETYQEAIKRLQSGSDALPICSSKNHLKQAGDIIFIDRNVRIDPPPNITAAVLENKDDRDYYEDKGIKTVAADEIDGIRLDSFFVVDRADVMAELEGDADTFLEWVENYRARR